MSQCLFNKQSRGEIVSEPAMVLMGVSPVVASRIPLPRSAVGESDFVAWETRDGGLSRKPATVKLTSPNPPARDRGTRAHLRQNLPPFPCC